MTPRQAATVKAKALFQNLREQYVEGDTRPELAAVIEAGEGAFVAANLARFDGEPEAETIPADTLKPHLLGREREIVAFAELIL